MRNQDKTWKIPGHPFFVHYYVTPAEIDHKMFFVNTLHYCEKIR